jgi:hypothetical protein
MFAFPMAGTLTSRARADATLSPEQAAHRAAVVPPLPGADPIDSVHVDMVFRLARR